MNGFAERGLDSADFGEDKGPSLKSFDAFPKTKPTYLTRTTTGGPWTLLLIVASVWLAISETRRWFAGTTTHSFKVEKGISHTMQMNIDIVVLMACHDVAVNIQDASGDRILASDILSRDGTSWVQWGELRNKKLHKLGDGKLDEEDWFGPGLSEDVHDYLGMAKGRRKFPKTPKLRGNPPDACRIYGSLHGNKVQGDFHITARGHGYIEFGEHLSHNAFNFSHQINELSFGLYYPSLVNPLDNTYAVAPVHFYKHQYYLSIVPTIYTEDASRVLKYDNPADPKNPFIFSPTTVHTNQYAVTEQSHQVSEMSTPGIFFKYDIEPVVLMVSEEWGGFLTLLVRLINIVSGVLVAGGWCLQLSDWTVENLRRKRRGGWESMGVLHGGRSSFDEKEYKV